MKKDEVVFTIEDYENIGKGLAIALFIWPFIKKIMYPASKAIKEPEPKAAE